MAVRKVVVDIWESGGTEENDEDRRVEGGFVVAYGEDTKIFQLNALIKEAFSELNPGQPPLRIKYVKDMPRGTYAGGILRDSQYAQDVIEAKDTIRVFRYPPPKSMASPPLQVRYGSVAPSSAVNLSKRDRGAQSSESFSPMIPPSKRRRLNATQAAVSVEKDGKEPLDNNDMMRQAAVVIVDSQRSPQQQTNTRFYDPREHARAEQSTPKTESPEPDNAHLLDSIPVSGGGSPATNANRSSVIFAEAAPVAPTLQGAQQTTNQHSAGDLNAANGQLRTPMRTVHDKNQGANKGKQRISNPKALSGQSRNQKRRKNIWSVSPDPSSSINEAHSQASTAITTTGNLSNHDQTSSRSVSGMSMTLGTGQSLERRAGDSQTSPNIVEDEAPPHSLLSADGNLPEAQLGVEDSLNYNSTQVDEHREDRGPSQRPEKSMKMKQLKDRNVAKFQRTYGRMNSNTGETSTSTNQPDQTENSKTNNDQEAVGSGVDKPSKNQNTHERLEKKLKEQRSQLSGISSQRDKVTPFNTAPIPGSSGRKSALKAYSESAEASSRASTDEKRSVSFLGDDHSKNASASITPTATKPRGRPKKGSSSPTAPPKIISYYDSLWALGFSDAAGDFESKIKKGGKANSKPKSSKNTALARSFTDAAGAGKSNTCNSTTRSLYPKPTPSTAKQSSPLINSQSLEEDGKSDVAEEAKGFWERGKAPDDDQSRNTDYKRLEVDKSDKSAPSAQKMAWSLAEEERSDPEPRPEASTRIETLDAEVSAKKNSSKLPGSSDNEREDNEGPDEGPTVLSSGDDSSVYESEEDEMTEDQSNTEAMVGVSNSVPLAESRSPAREINTADEDDSESETESDSVAEDNGTDNNKIRSSESMNSIKDPSNGKVNELSDQMERPQSSGQHFDASDSEDSEDSWEDECVKLPPLKKPAFHGNSSISKPGTSMMDAAELQLQREATQSMENYSTGQSEKHPNPATLSQTPKDLTSYQTPKVNPAHKSLHSSLFPSFTELKTESPTNAKTSMFKSSSYRSSSSQSSTDMSNDNSKSNSDMSGDDQNSTAFDAKAAGESRNKRNPGAYRSLMRHVNAQRK